MRSNATALFLISTVLLACSPDGKTEQGDQAATRDRQPVRIDWRMGERTRMAPDGQWPFPLPPDPSDISPSSWQVTLDGCSSLAPGPVLTWRWSVWSGDWLVAQQATRGCTLDLALPWLGDYAVDLTLSTVDGVEIFGRRTITLRDYLIVSMGDSVASGEGNPDIPGSGGGHGVWADPICNRSWRSGPAQAAVQLERADPHSSVTFVSVACSGGGVDRGILNPYTRKIASGGQTTLPSQIDQVVNLLGNGNRTIDALLIQAGANDIGFGKLAESCADPRTDPCYEEAAFDPIRLRGAFDALHDWWYPGLSASLTRLPIRNFFIGEYQDPVHGSDQLPCHIVFHGAGFGFIDGDISPKEASWAYGNVVLPLQSTIQRSANEWGWHVISYTDAFAEHGYCASDSWIRTFEDSKRDQGDEDGTLHPNGAGHSFMGGRIADAVWPLIVNGGI
jgi:hypothetical protein